MKPTYEAFATRKEKGKTFWTRLGVAFAGEKGISLYLSAMPTGQDGQYQLVLLPFKERAEAEPGDIQVDG